jgi:head-tail adaptor
MAASQLPGAGCLNRRILCRLWSDVPNGAFGLDQTFDAGVSRWAKVEPIHSLTLRADVNTGEAPTHLVWVRYGTGSKPEDFTASHVIEWRGRRYRVVDSINVDGLDRFTRLSVKDLGAI